MDELKQATAKPPRLSTSIARMQLPRLTLLLAILAAAVPTATSAKRPFVVKPPPQWVKPMTAPQPGGSHSTEAATGSRFLLSDNQIRVNGGSTEQYSRRVRKVLNISALEDLSQLQLEFEPSYQELVIHHVTIQRDQQTIDALRPNEIKIIQQETDLYQRQYNGTLSALIFLNDVRVGDIIDYAFSVIGQNPVLGGRFADIFSLATTQPVERLQWRLIWPAKRRLHYRALNTAAEPTTQIHAEEIEYTWAEDNVPAFAFEENTPEWFRPMPAVQLSEFVDWEDVVRWALPLYALKHPIDGSLEAQIKIWRAEAEDPEKRMMSALRFVQDAVRYMGIELGPYSHTPVQPSAVFARRFGDCKDKSLLLSTILNSLDIDASPALVNTSAQHTISDWQPSPYAFDHVIVRATLNEKTYWLDATANLQRGGLPELYNPNYGQALVLREGATELEAIPRDAGETPTTEVVEVYSVPNYKGPAQLEVSTIYRKSEANGMRSWIAEQTISEIGKAYLNYYARFDADIEAVMLPQVSDDAATNTIVIIEKYTIPRFWKDNTRQFYAGRIDEDLGKPGASKRTMPLALYYPSRVSQIIEAHLPERFAIDASSRTVETEAIRFKYQSVTSGNTIRLSYQFRALSDHVAADKIARHIDAVDRIRATLGYEISATGRPADFKISSLIPITMVLGPFVLFGVYKALKSMRASGRQTSFKQRAQAAAGGTPETAIPLKAGVEIARTLAEYKCRCGVPYVNDDTPPQTESAVFDGQRLTVIRLTCDTCSRIQDVYFIAAGPGPSLFQN